MSSSVAVPKPHTPAQLLVRIGAMFSFETACMAAYAPLLSLYMQQKLALTPYEIGGKTKLTNTLVFQSVEDRDGMLHSGMESGQAESFARLDEILKKAG